MKQMKVSPIIIADFAGFEPYIIKLLTNKIFYLIEPIIMDCQMEIVCAQWNHDGSILAIGGIQVNEDKESNIVQFFNPWGQVTFN